ncbi:YhbY family RNA-binding protein [Ideonella sp.]|jgi:RNA-binding protein|uniref:YhbY family RNA-binding protein n=1 Tax=Ideonella sp. TaxID=1929293 RepID=UPI0037BE38C9
MPAIQLTPADRKDKRGQAHHLNPVVMIGNDGLTPAIVKECDAALKAHGLIKVRVFSDDREARGAMLDELADKLSAAPVQHIGKLLVLWRPLPDSAAEPAHDGGTRGGAAPRTVRLVTYSKSGHSRPEIKKVQVLGNERITAGGQIKRAKARVISAKKKALNSK